MSEMIEKRLRRLKGLRTELQNLGLEGAAEEVEDEIEALEMLPTDNPAVAELLEATMGMEKALNEAERRGGNG